MDIWSLNWAVLKTRTTGSVLFPIVLNPCNVVLYRNALRIPLSISTSSNASFHSPPAKRYSNVKPTVSFSTSSRSNEIVISPCCSPRISSISTVGSSLLSRWKVMESELPSTWPSVGVAMTMKASSSTKSRALTASVSQVYASSS